MNSNDVQCDLQSVQVRSGRLCVCLLICLGSLRLAIIVIVLVIVIVLDLRLLGAGRALGRGTRAGSEHWSGERTRECERK